MIGEFRQGREGNHPEVWNPSKSCGEQMGSSESVFQGILESGSHMWVIPIKVELSGARGDVG